MLLKIYHKMIEYLIYIIAGIFIIGFLYGSMQEQKRYIESFDWIKAEATIVEKILISTEPNDYGAVVSYDFDGKTYESEAEMFMGKTFRGKLKGEQVKVKINPNDPSRCVLCS
ncbi:DUF3592 domain-containing protein [Mesorhizobium yinganensis]|uniref:DUF3592 domain-containing protein n=1 Tax=Mesorhizobium yinganensis TaxID=3157707 RepID=UPI0032B73C34